MLDRWSSAVIRLRHVVVGVWLVAAVLGLLGGRTLSSLLTTPLSVPGTGSATANHILLRDFGESVEGTFTIVVPIRRTSPEGVRRDESLISDAVRRVPTARIAAQRGAFGVLFAVATTTLGLNRAASETGTLRHALAVEGLRAALVTGPPALQHDVTPVLTADLRRGELLALVFAALLLMVMLGLSGSVVVPLLVAAVTIAVDVGVVFLLAHSIPIVLYTPNVIELIALGLAIDYSLLIVHRFRQEIEAEPTDTARAIRVTMHTAGRTVLLSGGVVAIGLAALAAVDVPFLRSLGAAGLVVPVVAVLAAMTLQPALLALLGPRGVRAIGRTRRAGSTLVGRRWARLATAVVRKPGLALTGALLALAAAAFSILWLQLTPASTSGIPPTLPSARALTMLSSHVGPGAITPDQIVIDLGHARRAASPRARASTLRLARAVAHDPEVFAIALGYGPPFVDRTGRYEQLLIFARDQFGSEKAQQLVRELRDTYVRRTGFGRGAHLYVGGAAAEGVDFLDAVYGVEPWIVLAALVLAGVVLARALRSLLLALVSVVLSLVTVVAALGLLVLFVRFGVGALLLGTYQMPQLEGWVPVFLFALLFGLSMDYQLFFVSRMRESYDDGADTKTAVVNGLSRTGGVVSAAALVLIAAVSGLVFGHVAGLQELGLGLILGILLDVTIVRALVLPSAMALLGRWSWWLPEGAARVLRTTASPLEPRGVRPQRAGPQAPT